MPVITSKMPKVEQPGNDVYRLLQQVEAKFPSETVGKDKWYIVALATITGGTQPWLAADLYKYLIQKAEYSTSESRQALIRRMRESLVKMFVIVGTPKPLEAIFAIADIERDEDKDYSFSR